MGQVRALTRFGLALAIAVCAMLGGASARGETDETLLILNQDAALSVAINGAAVVSDDGTQPLQVTPAVSTLLLNGANQVTVSFHPLPVQPPEKPALRMVLLQIDDSGNTNEVWKLSLPLAQDASVDPTTVSDGAVLAGGFAPSTNLLTWVDQGGTSTWSMRFADADAPNGVPSSMILAPDQSVLSATVAFSNADGSHYVEFDGVDLVADATTNEASIDFTALTPAIGADQLGATDIDTVTVSYPTSGPELNSGELYLVAPPPAPIDATFSVQVSLSPTKQGAMAEIAGNWQTISAIGSGDDMAIRQAVGQLQDAFANQDSQGVVGAAGYFFSIDGRLRGQDPGTYAGNVASMLGSGPFSDPGFQMVPLDPDTDLTLQIAPSGRLVHITRLDGSSALQSVDNGNGHVDMDVYAALIDFGQGPTWTLAETNDVLP